MPNVLSNVPGSLKLQAKRQVIESDRLVSWNEFLQPDRSLPLVIRPTVKNLNANAWVSSNREKIETQLHRYGAILFRDFPLSTPDDFRAFVASVSERLIDYKERTSPRSEVGQQVYTSTDYPSQYEIFPHNEHSYAQVFPRRLFFFCERPADVGGRTPIGDCRKVLGRLPASVTRRFAERRWMYVRNFGSGVGLSWRTTFQTEDRSLVEEYCRRSNVEFEWLDNDRLRTRQIRDAVIKHPSTNELCWFNHATFFHVSTLEPSVRDPLIKEFAREDLPNNTYYGDGGEIEEDTLAALREAYKSEMIEFDWQPGDVLMVDNILTAHARTSYQGDRRILVAMTDPINRNALC